MIKKRIILVEDEPDLLKSVTLTLRRSGYEVDPFDRAANAFALILIAEQAREPFDLLVTDLRLPGFSGIDLVRKIRNFGNTMPVAAITAFANREVRMALKENGCLFCLDKPFNTEELLWHISNALGGKETAGISLDNSS